MPGGTAALAQCARHRSGARSRPLHLRAHAAALQHARRPQAGGRRVPARAAAVAARAAARDGRSRPRPARDRAGAADGATSGATRSSIARWRRASWSPRSSPIARAALAVPRPRVARRRDAGVLRAIIRRCSTRIYERSAPAFARVLRAACTSQGNRVVPPGGERDAVAAVGSACVAREGDAPRSLHRSSCSSSNDGRLAYLYDVIGQLDPPRRAFALGLWMPNAAARAERFKALTLGVGALPRIAPADAAVRPRVLRPGDDADAHRGRRRRHAGARRRRAASGRACSAAAICPTMPARQLRDIDEEPIDAAWLVEAIGAGRRARARRAARSDRVRPAAVRRGRRGGARATCSSRCARCARYRMLMWTLERIGIRAPAVYARGGAARGAPRRARRPPRLRGAGAVQGALALVARMASVRTLDAATAQALDRAARRAAADRGRPVRAARSRAGCATTLAGAIKPRRHHRGWRCSRRCPGRRRATARSRGR